MIFKIYSEDLYEIFDNDDKCEGLLIDYNARRHLYESVTHILDKINYYDNRENLSMKDKIVFDNMHELRLALQDTK